MKPISIVREERAARGIRFSIAGENGEVARAYLYLMTNDLHDAPFGLLEDVFVAETERGGGLGTALVNEVIAAAREAGSTSSSRRAAPRDQKSTSSMSDWALRTTASNSA